MTGFDSWLTPQGQPLGKAPADWLPPRLSPSWMDNLRDSLRRVAAQKSTNVGVVSAPVSFDDIVDDRPDAPYFTALNGRAGICLRLSPQNAPSIDSLLPAGRQDTGLHFQAYTRGGYPILRTVLLLPTEATSFESPLFLTNGDVQEFIIATLDSEIIELHLSKTDDDRSLSVVCQAHGVRAVLGNALDALRPLDHSADDDQRRHALDRMTADFPEVTDGLSERTQVVLHPTNSVSPVVTVEMHF